MAKTARSKSQPAASTAEANQQPATPGPPATQEEIALRAYHLYLERGEAEGDSLSDWLQAERELTEADASNRVVK